MNKYQPQKNDPYTADEVAENKEARFTCKCGTPFAYCFEAWWELLYCPKCHDYTYDVDTGEKNGELR